MELITLRTLEVAQRFPQELPADLARQAAGQQDFCTADGTPMRRVVMTTYGDYGDASVWRAYPLAVDVWICGTQQHLVYAFLSPAEATAIIDEGAAAAASGDLDRAEFCFRRVTSSWSTFTPGRINLGSVYLDRIKREQSGAADPTEIRRLLDVATYQFETALVSTPPAPPQVRLMLGRMYVRSDRGAQARAHLDVVVADAATPEPMKAQARELIAEIEERAAPPIQGPSLEHPYISLRLPPAWRQLPEAPGELFARFVGPDEEFVDVVIAELPGPVPAAVVKAKLAELADGHARSLDAAYGRRCQQEVPPYAARDSATYADLMRNYDCGPVWRVLGRYAMTTGTLVMRDGRQVMACVYVAYHGHLWGREAVEAAIAYAKLFPVLDGAPLLPRQDDLELVPYLLGPSTITRRDELLVQAGQPPEGARGLGHVGGGLYLTLAVNGTNVSPLFPSDIAADGIDEAPAMTAACDWVAARLGTDDLPIQLFNVTPWAIPAIWQPGMHAVVAGTDTVKLLVAGPSWMAASAAATRQLFERARQALGTEELRVFVPHRDRCFVFATKGWELDRAFADGILRAEHALAAKPLTTDIYALTPLGIAAVPRSAFESHLFALRVGASHQQTEDAIIDVPQQWNPPTDLIVHVEEFPDARVIVKFVSERLYNVNLQIVIRGDWAAFEALDAELRAALPSVVLWYRGKQPWSPAVARAELEGQGKPGVFVAVPVEGNLVHRGQLSGQAIASKRDGAQLYGFQLYWTPEARI